MKYTIIWLLCCPAYLLAQLPEGFFDQKLPLNFDNPIGLLFEEGGAMFIWEKKGVVHLVPPDGQPQTEPVINIQEEVTNWNDHGLMGFALDPNFAVNGWVYLLYAVDLHHYLEYGTPSYSSDSTVINHPTFGRITRYQVKKLNGAWTSDPQTRKVILGNHFQDGIPLLNPFHGLGHLQFGADGSLLISIGNSSTGTDTGKDPENSFIHQALDMGLIDETLDIGSYRSQYLGSHGGKILRINPIDGSGYLSNPFYQDERPQSAQSRIWAYGFRNPYRFNIFPNTGEHYPDAGDPGTLIVGDVGDASWEELNVVEKGGQNFGWPITEGMYWNWTYHQAPTPSNFLAPNPLFETGSCDQAYFNFRDLFQWPSNTNNEFFPNPCANGISIESTFYPTVATPPVIAYNHQKWNPPTRAEIPGFDQKGQLVGIPIQESGTTVTGSPFEGDSSIGGVFYSGTAFPAPYRGLFFSLDHSGWIRTFEFDKNKQLKKTAPFHDNSNTIIYLAYNPKDEALYYISILQGIHKISYGGNLPPKAIITVDKSFGPAPLTVQFDGQTSSGTTAPIKSYHWDFGDGQVSNLPNPSHQFVTSGNTPVSRIITLTVTDSTGTSDAAQQLIALNNTPPKVRINSLKEGDQYPIHQSTLVRLAATVEDQEHKTETLSYEWQTFFHHNDHFHVDPPQLREIGFALLSPLGCDLEAYWYRIRLKVTDPNGLTGMDEVSIYPNCNAPFVNSLNLNGQIEQEEIMLNWEVNENNGPLEFEVQKSEDFNHFDVIGHMTSDQPTFSFTDVTPKRGRNIYRIKAKSGDQAFVYSNTISIVYPEPPEVQVYPNPVHSLLNIEFKPVNTETLDFNLYNISGQLVLRKIFTVTPNQANTRTINVNALPNGVYSYVVENKNSQVSGYFLIAH